MFNVKFNKNLFYLKSQQSKFYLIIIIIMYSTVTLLLNVPMLGMKLFLFIVKYIMN